MSDLISREMAIDHIKNRLYQTAVNNLDSDTITTFSKACESIADNRIEDWINEIPRVSVAGLEGR